MGAPLPSILFDMTVPKIGDFILLTPTLQAVQKIYPRSLIIVPEPLRGLYAREKVLKNMIGPSDVIGTTDEIIDLTYPLLEFTPARAAKVFDKDCFDQAIHVSVMYHQALRRILPLLPETFEAKPFLQIDADVERLSGFNLKPFTYFTVHTGSDFAPKNWGDDNFESVILKAAEEFPDIPCVGLFGPQDNDIFTTQAAPPTFRSLRTNMEGVADILAGSLFHIDNDSGINHLAGAMNTPSISVWGFTGPGTWGALGDQHFTFWGGPSCADHCGGAKSFSCQNRVCIKSIVPADLLEAVRDIVGNYNLVAGDSLGN